jgi:hypothetical protein
MASADFSLHWSHDPRHPFRRKARSPQVRTSAFAARPPDLRCLALVTRASRLHARLPCSAPPSIRFLFVGPQLRSPLPSRRPHGTTLCATSIACSMYASAIAATTGWCAPTSPSRSPICFVTPISRCRHAPSRWRRRKSCRP